MSTAMISDHGIGTPREYDAWKPYWEWLLRTWPKKVEMTTEQSFIAGFINGRTQRDRELQGILGFELPPQEFDPPENS